MLVYKVTFLPGNDLKEGRCDHDGSEYMLDTNNAKFWIVGTPDDKLAVELFVADGTCAIRATKTLQEWTASETGVVVTQEKVGIRAESCKNCEDAETEQEGQVQLCSKKKSIDPEVTRPRGLPAAWPNKRKPQKAHDGIWYVLIHHLMRGDMYTLGAALLLDGKLCVVLIQPAVEELDHTGRHLAWFKAILGKQAEQRILIESVSEEECLDWQKRRDKRMKLEKAWVEGKELHETRIHEAKTKSAKQIEVERSRVPKGKEQEFESWVLNEQETLRLWIEGEDQEYGKWKQGLEENLRETIAGEDVDREHYKSMIASPEQGYNFPGTVTNEVGRHFERNSSKARETIRAGFFAGLDTGSVEAFAQKYCADILKLGPKDVCAIAFVRNVKPRTDEDLLWNVSATVYAQLHELLSSVEPKDGKVLVVPAGDEVGECKKADGNLVKLWERAPFTTKLEGHPDVRLQLYLYDYLLRNSQCRFVILGMRSGMLEPFAMLGMPVVYLEKRGTSMDRSIRMRQWNGRIPYMAAYISRFPYEGPLQSEDLVHVRRRVLEAIAYSAPQEVYASGELNSTALVTLLLPHEARFASYERLNYKKYSSPFVGSIRCAGGSLAEFTEPEALKKALVAFVGSKGKPARCRISELTAYIEDYDSGEYQFDEECEDALLHALACCCKRTLILYDGADVLLPIRVECAGDGEPILLLWNSEIGYCPLVPATSRRDKPKIQWTQTSATQQQTQSSSSQQQTLSSSSQQQTTVSSMNVDMLPCDMCGKSIDTVKSPCTKKASGCKEQFVICRGSVCQQTYFSIRDACGDGNNRCKPCLLLDGAAFS